MSILFYFVRITATIRYRFAFRSKSSQTNFVLFYFNFQGTNVNNSNILTPTWANMCNGLITYSFTSNIKIDLDVKSESVVLIISLFDIEV